MLNNSKWIWFEKEDCPDSYGEFVDNFNVSSGNDIKLFLTSDSNYNVYINDTLVGFSICADYLDRKEVDEIDISKYCKKGNNAIRVNVWYYGVSYQTYIKDSAGVIFAVKENDKDILNSNENTKSRKDIRFESGKCKFITPQLGFSYTFDNEIENNLEYEKSFIKEKSRSFILRKRKNLTLGDLKLSKEISKKLFDFQRETVGYLSFEIYSEKAQTIIISYGEHLDENGRVPRHIGVRDFSFTFKLKKGVNKIENVFRRLALRYIYVEAEGVVKVNYLGILPVLYKMDKKEFTLSNKELQKIYDASVYTLECCMHEHYEDCPWREQALYSMDSRNQMLCGYYAFSNFEYARYNLVFISKGLRQDGLLSICYPAGVDIPIPSFSVIYIKMVAEYIKYSKDTSILAEVLPTIKTIFNKFYSSIDENGLIPTFKYPCWNFYEWTPYSDRENEIARSPEEYKKQYDLIINCMLLYVQNDYEGLTGEKVDLSSLKNAIKGKFKVNGLYKLSTSEDAFSKLGNAFAVLAGLEDKSFCEQFKNNDDLIDCSLSMKLFYYEAIDDAEFILNDIRKTYTYMLDHGATTFWETIKGSVDFDNAGSLCHGWSALPVIYFNKYKEILEKE